MTAMVARFQKSRWSPTRIAIHALGKGESITFGPDQYHNAKATVDRLNDAYDGSRVYKLTGCTAKVTVGREE